MAVLALFWLALLTATSLTRIQPIRLTLVEVAMSLCGLSLCGRGLGLTSILVLDCLSLVTERHREREHPFFFFADGRVGGMWFRGVVFTCLCCGEGGMAGVPKFGRL